MELADSQIFAALLVALIPAVLAYRLGTALYGGQPGSVASPGTDPAADPTLDFDGCDCFAEQDNNDAIIARGLEALNELGSRGSSVTVRNAPGCSTHVLKGLDLQIIAKMNAVLPNALASIADLNISAGPAVHAYLQPAAKEALRKAIADRGQPLSMNSGYRTIAQQLMLYNHSLRRRCGISIAARPGRSNHQSGLAMDINDAPGWKPYLERYGWRWFGSRDRVHFDYVGSGARDIRSVAIKAFQSLWNENNPNDSIGADGAYGPATEARLNQSPISGFGNAPTLEMRVATRVLKVTNPMMQGDDVRQLQAALVAAGINVDTDGYFGAGTAAAVTQFQQQKGLDADGIVGPATRLELGL